MKTIELAQVAKAASIALAASTTESKHAALKAIADALWANREVISLANQKDMALAEARGLELPLLKRLKFDDSKLAEVTAGIESLIALPEPVGQQLSATELDEGLDLYRVSCPIGVIGVIFESRPDALVQISSLCLKSGNAVLLKGGSEALNTNRVLAEIIARASEAAGMPPGWLKLLETRADVGDLLKLDTLVDLIIPRGSNEFVKHIMDHSNIPVLGHADGICHLYVDSEADLAMAVDLTVDSKCQYVAVCNALETLLVHEKVAAEFLPALAEKMTKETCELRGCEKTAAIIACTPATADDWATEYLDYILSVKVVESMTDAINHINTYGSGHTDVIVTQSAESAEQFMNGVDAGNVFWNASTRFSDGFRYGLGAEVGISTNKIHARGPVGLEGLLIYKWKLFGDGQTVKPYADGEKSFTHRKLG